MDWLNLHISVLDSPQVLRCDPVRRATWLFLLRYCISQENGGVIADCASWGDTSWQQIVRVKLREVRAESPLWTWEGDNLRVTFYPIEKEADVQRLRNLGRMTTEAKAEAARNNGKKGGRKPNGMGSDNPTQSPTQNPRITHEEPIEWNGKEGKGKEYTPAAAAAVVAHEPPAGSDGARHKIQGFNRTRIQRAVANADPLEIIAAFGGARDEQRDAEWTRDAAGMVIGELVAVLWRAQQNRRAVRQPSGLRAQREDWDDQPLESRRGWIREAFADLGIPMPAPRTQDPPQEPAA